MENSTKDRSEASYLKIEAVNPQDLSERDIAEINEVSQDIWATEEGLGELAQCTCCNKMLSKEVVFSWLPKDIRDRKTVAEIMKFLNIEQIDCTYCGSETRLIYGPENIEMIRERVLRSVDSFLVLCRNEQDKIVGFEEGYIASIEQIFERDLAYHYRKVGVAEIKQRVALALGHEPDVMLILSSIGLLAPYRNFANLVEILNQFARTIPEKYSTMPGITELDKGGPIYKLSKNINEGISLGIHDAPELRAKITDVGENYNSDLIVYHSPAKMYKENFTKGWKHVIKASSPRRVRPLSPHAVPTEKIDGPNHIML